jgi:hypothetical protein
VFDDGHKESTDCHLGYLALNFPHAMFFLPSNFSNLRLVLYLLEIVSFIRVK